jgi:anti-anti-sigma regulatory factor
MAQVKNWRAKRAGGRITVYGEDPATNQQIKIVGVDKIEPPAHASDPLVLAVDKHGAVHHLLLG